MQILQLVFPTYEYYFRNAIILPISLFYVCISCFIYLCFYKWSILFWHQMGAE